MSLCPFAAFASGKLADAHSKNEAANEPCFLSHRAESPSPAASLGIAIACRDSRYRRMKKRQKTLRDFYRTPKGGERNEIV
ncbi:MAG: hypothetical protein J6J31_11275 [Thermoguttaceae bacterium]|nr:hypothetical protein [Thermoguttaceae bacterium]